MEIVYIDLDCVDSTSDYAKRNYASFCKEKITCITAEEQTAGRGRYQRKWISPKGVNIYATLFFQLPRETAHITTLAQVMAASLASILSEQEVPCKMKWPNDLQIDKKKISGILCETIFEADFVSIFLGIGINVNMEKEALLAIDQPATSLREETKKTWDKKKLLEKLVHQFAKDLVLLKKQGFAPFHKKLNEILAYKGESVCYTDGVHEWEGLCESINLEGGLNLLLHPTKSCSIPKLHTLFSGDLIMRKKEI